MYVAISVRPHRKFRRDGANLYSEMNISFAQAALGDELTIETLQEPVKQTITEGTQPGQVLRVKGQGVPSPAQSVAARRSVCDAERRGA